MTFERSIPRRWIKQRSPIILLSSLSNVNSISSANIVINNNITNVEESGIKYNPRIIIIIIIKNLSKWKIFEKRLIYIYITSIEIFATCALVNLVANLQRLSVDSTI